jgi:hypothetical protein
MDKQAALRWVQNNIRQFGEDPDNVTLAGRSAIGLSVLAQWSPPGGHGLFQRAIVESESFALSQQPLAMAVADGESLLRRPVAPTSWLSVFGICRSIPSSVPFRRSPFFVLGQTLAVNGGTFVPVLP